MIMTKINFEFKYNIEKSLRKELISEYRELKKENIKMRMQINKLSNFILKLYSITNKLKTNKKK